jgi:hypothetical protein
VKVCEYCGGTGCRHGGVLCPTCAGTGMILLGQEGVARYEQMKRDARAKAARLGWIEEVWEPVDPVTHYPALARKVFRVVVADQAKRKAS